MFITSNRVLLLERKHAMRILSIETSCDETAIAIADFTRAPTGARVNVSSHIVSSQTRIHAAFGGVVPNLARREHQQNLVPTLMSALTQAQMLAPQAPARHQAVSVILEREQYLLSLVKKHLLAIDPPPIDAIAATYGPGLAPALWVGVNFARALAELWQKPLIPVNHMAGHFFSALLQKDKKQEASFSIPSVPFPVLGLLVSGGHTELVLVKKPWHFSIIGTTLDDAVGEAYDKIGRLMGLSYPGGPALSHLAAQGDARKYHLPSPMLNTKDYHFSFSGLKTAAFYLIRGLPPATFEAERKADIAASFEKAALDVLVKKTLRAAKEYKAKTVLIGGGVSANRVLRKRLGDTLAHELPACRFLAPDPALAGDNALMIATAAYMTGMKKARNISDVRADANVVLG